MLETLDRTIRRIFVRNLHLKVIALLLTMALYLWVSVDREVERIRYAPLRMDVPAEMVMVNDPPRKVGISIRGKWSDISQLEPSRIDTILVPIDPAMGRRGRISLTPDMVNLPPGLRAVDIDPNVVQFRLEQRQTKRVKLRPQVRGELPEGYQLEETAVSPPTLEISGPKNSLDKIAQIPTEAVDLSGQTGSFTQRVRPRLEDPLVDYHLDRPLQMSVTVGTEQIERTYAGLDVEPVNADSAVVTSVKPGRVTATFRGPKAVLDALERSQLLASVELGGERVDTPRTVEREVQIRNRPAGVELVDKQPRFFRVHLAPKSAQHARE